MAPNVGDETTVNDSYSVTVPAVVREQADIGVGDEIIEQRVGVSEYSFA